MYCSIEALNFGGMNLESNKRWAKLMISLGLLLLAIGLSLWTYSEYKQKEKALQEKSETIFVQSILEVESYLSSKLITLLIDINEQKNDSLDFSLENAIIKQNAFINNKQTNNPIFYSFDHHLEEIKIEATSEDSFKLEIGTSSDSMKYEIAGITKNSAGEIRTSMRTFSVLNDSIGLEMGNNHKDINLFPLLEETIYSKIDSFNLSNTLSFELTEEESANPNVFQASNSPWIFTDIIFPQAFTFKVDGYQLYLIKRIIPQIILSFFIIGMIGLAFYFIYQTLLKQEQLNILKNDFMNNMTHELKTPITTIGVALEAIENFGVDKNPELRKEYIDISRLEVNRLSLLVDKVLHISKYENTSIILEEEVLDFSKIIHQTLKTLKLQFQKNNAEFNIKIEGNHFSFTGDKSHITNVIYNLIDNALKYGGTPPKLDFILKENDHSILFSVTDNGNGISDEYKEQIFDKFFRIPKNDIHNVKGHGLGLSYVKKILEMHGGQISLDSEINNGSTFTIEIPKKQ